MKLITAIIALGLSLATAHAASIGSGLIAGGSLVNGTATGGSGAFTIGNGLVVVETDTAALVATQNTTSLEATPNGIDGTSTSILETNTTSDSASLALGNGIGGGFGGIQGTGNAGGVFLGAGIFVSP